MTEFCAFGDYWVLPLVAVVGGVVVGTLVGYSMWKFGVSPVKLKNQQLRQFNQELAQDLTAANRWNRFHFDAYTREKEKRIKIEALYEDRLEALKKGNKKRHVSETKGEGSSSTLQKGSKPQDNSDGTSESENVSLDFEGPNCPLENYVINPEYVADLFDLFYFFLYLRVGILVGLFFGVVIKLIRSFGSLKKKPSSFKK